MEEQILDLFEGLIEGRNDFFTRTMQLTPHNQRSGLLSRFMMNEICYLEVINRLYQNHIRNNTATATVTLTIPSNFSDPVTVAPTQEQINSAIQNIDNTTSNCAICQETISSDGCKIRQCGHVYHRNCITSWLRLNVRCPVCRQDIREDQSIQTLSDEE